jgi:hypothetical protein
MMRRAPKTRRPRAWKISQRRAFGRASFQRPSRHSNWNHRTRSPARATTISQFEFASKMVNGNRQSPVLQSLDVTLDVSVGGMMTSSCTGSPSASV